ncbi:MAG: hypothetical protein PVH87_10150 [Desulfobacteraceae bacterium]|jgi:hypothetical protein
MAMIIDSGVVGNVVLLFFTGACGGAWLSYFRRCGNTLAEAVAYALMATIMAQAWLAQVILLAGWPSLYLPALIIGAVFFANHLFNHRRTFFSQVGILIQFIRNHRMAASGLLLVWGYVAVVWFWPLVQVNGPNLDYYQPIWNHARSILSVYTSSPDMVLPVLNHAVFSASWQPPQAIAIANLGAYAAIGFSTYALARRYAWPPMAITVTLLVVSMHRVVQQSMTTPSELLPAAAALVSILALYRLCEQPHGHDTGMHISALAYTVAGGRLCYLMAAVLCGLSVVALSRRYGFGALRPNMSGRRPGIWVVFALVVVFSQGAYVCANLIVGRPWIGEPIRDSVVFNPDALLGTVGNLVRYLLLSFDLPEFVEQFAKWGFGFSLLDGLKGAYHWLSAKPFAGKGAAVIFDWSWTSGSGFSWFGPAGFCLVIPSVGMALLRGPRRLKAVAMAMTVYWVLIALILAWRPENVRWMTNFFVCTGFFMAFLLPPWRIGRNGRMVLQTVCILLLGYALLST